MSCSLGTLGPDNDGSFTITVQVPTGTATGTIIIDGNYQISATNVSPLIGSMVQTTVAAGAQYSDVMVAATEGKTTIDCRASRTTYTLTVTNIGPTASTSVAVADTMPAQLTGVTWTCAATASSTCAASGSGNIADTVSLAVNGVATYTVHATIVAGSGVGNVKMVMTATVGGAQSDPATSSHTGVDNTAIGNGRVLTVTKTTAASLGTIRVGAAGRPDVRHGLYVDHRVVR